jgi:hypothetical protein
LEISLAGLIGHDEVSEEARIQSFWNWCQTEHLRLDGQIALINA